MIQSAYKCLYRDGPLRRVVSRNLPFSCFLTHAIPRADKDHLPWLGLRPPIPEKSPWWHNVDARRSNAESSTLRVVVHAPDCLNFLTEIQTRDWAIVRSVLCSLICHKTNSYDIWRGRTVRCSGSADDTSRRQLDTAVEDLLHQLNKFRIGIATSLTLVHKFDDSERQVWSM